MVNLHWFESHSQIVSLIFSFVVAISTAVYAWLTRSLVKETERLRRLETEPEISVFLAPHGKSNQTIGITLQNHSRAPARNLQITCSPTAAALEEHNIHLGFFESLNGLRYLAPGQDFTSVFAVAPKLFVGDKTVPLVTVTLKFANSNGGETTQTFELDANSLRGYLNVRDTFRHDLLKRLDNIAKAIKSKTDELT